MSRVHCVGKRRLWGYELRELVTALVPRRGKSIVVEATLTEHDRLAITGRNGLLQERDVRANRVP